MQTKLSSSAFLTCVRRLTHVIAYSQVVRPSVRPSVCLSRAGIVSKRLNLYWESVEDRWVHYMLRFV